MVWKCGICQVTGGVESPEGTQEDLIEHMEEHGPVDLETWLVHDTGKQTTLGEIA